MMASSKSIRMFRAIRAFFERRRTGNAIDSLFGRHVSRDVAKVLSESKGVLTPARVERQVDIVLISVAATSDQAYSDRCVEILSLAEQHGGNALNLLSVMVVIFGILGDVPLGARLAFVAELQARCAQEVSVIHGCVTAQTGCFGSARHVFFGVWWPGVTAALRQLTELPAGEIFELKPS
jgi:hypothetical protein